MGWYYNLTALFWLYMFVKSVWVLKYRCSMADTRVHLFPGFLCDLSSSTPSCNKKLRRYVFCLESWYKEHQCKSINPDSHGAWETEIFSCGIYNSLYAYICHYILLESFINISGYIHASILECLAQLLAVWIVCLSTVDHSCQNHRKLPWLYFGLVAVCTPQLRPHHEVGLLTHHRGVFCYQYIIHYVRA